MGFFDTAKSFNNTMGGISAGLGAAASIGGLVESISQNKKANKLAQQQLDLAREQFAEEKDRYNKREAERLEANANVAAAAGSYDNPMTRS